MMQYSVYQLLCLFLIYAFLGWCVEVCFVAVTCGNVVNRGFLNGPVCPIYGVGMIGVLLLLEPISGNLPLLFFLGMLLCSLVELIGGWALERVFHTRWWDYTDKPFNLGGYICLQFSIMWGLAVAFVVRLVHPLVLYLVECLPVTLGWVLIALFYGLFVTDFVLTIVTIAGMKRKLGELERVGAALETVGDTLSQHLGTSAQAADARLDDAREKGQQKLEEAKDTVAEAMEAGQKRLEEARDAVTEAVDARQKRLEEARDAVTEAVEAGQKRLEEAREAVTEAVDARQKRLEMRLTETVQELEDRKSALETRQRELLRAIRKNRFGAPRIGSAFPALREGLIKRLDALRQPEDTDEER